jgi:hypothetical protein
VTQVFRELEDGTVIHEGPNKRGHKVESIWVFISVGEDGDEGVVAAPIGGALMPLVASDETRLHLYIPVAERIATQTGMTIKLIKLGTREEIRIIEPKR